MPWLFALCCSQSCSINYSKLNYSLIVETNDQTMKKWQTQTSICEYEVWGKDMMQQLAR